MVSVTRESYTRQIFGGAILFIAVAGALVL